MKAQISVEYLVIIAFSLAILIPAGYLIYNYSKTSNDDTIRLQINQMGNDMMRNAESIYGLSEGSLVTLEYKYPSNIRDIYILRQNELIIKYEISSGINEAVFFSKIPLSGPYNLTNVACTMPCENSTLASSKAMPGRHNIKFESKTSYVMMSIK